MWPAVIFAISRIDNVIGRIKFLVNSIIVRIGIKKGGDLIGTMWEKNKFVFFMEKYIINLNHIVIDKGRIKGICVVIANEDGIKEVIFVTRIK